MLLGGVLRKDTGVGVWDALGITAAAANGVVARSTGTCSRLEAKTGAWKKVGWVEVGTVATRGL